MSTKPPLPQPTSSLLSALLSLRSTPPRIIQSPPTQPRRASVALIIRLKPPEGLEVPLEEEGWGRSLEDFFRLPWVQHPSTTPQILFIRRTTRPSDRYSSHIAFPGGRCEPGDTSQQYTALRETWEEIGIDLAEKEFKYVGRLDDREITTSLGKRLLMILSPFVFLQTTPHSPTPDLQPSEISSLHWIDLSVLSPPYQKDTWGNVEIDISSRLSPRNRMVRMLLRGLVGNMKFASLLLPDQPDCVSPEFHPEFDTDPSFSHPSSGSGTYLHPITGTRQLRLWGLTLGMTLDLLSHLPSTSNSRVGSRAESRVGSRDGSPVLGRGEKFDLAGSGSAGEEVQPKTPVIVGSSFDDEGVGRGVDVKVGVERSRRGVGPGITAIFPRFSYPDVNMFIWLFSRRYRRLLRRWEESTRGPNSERVNWSGAALSAFYTAVRQALVVAIVVRALITAGALGTAGWWLWRYWSA